MKLFYPQNKSTYRWLIFGKWIYYALLWESLSDTIMVICGHTLHWESSVYSFLLFLSGSLMAMDVSYGTKVDFISIDEANKMVIIRYKTLLFIHKEKRISFEDFEYAFNNCTNHAMRGKIFRLFLPSARSDLRILDKKKHKIFFRDTYGWTIEQVSEIAEYFSQIKPPKDFDEVAPW